MNFFQVLQSTLLNSFMTGISIIYKNQSIICFANQFAGFYMIGTFVMKELKKILLKKDASHLKIACHQRKNTEKRERKIKNDNTINIFLLLHFYIEKFISCSKTYLEYLVLCCYICITVFLCGRLWKMQK